MPVWEEHLEAFIKTSPPVSLYLPNMSNSV